MFDNLKHRYIFFQFCLSSKYTEKVCQGTEYTPNQKSCQTAKECQGRAKCIEVFEPIEPDEKQDKEYECGKSNEFHFHWYDNIKNFIIGHFKLVGGKDNTQYQVFEKRHKFKNDDEKKKYEVKRQEACCDALGAIHGRQNDPKAQKWIFCYNCMAEMWKRPEICGDFISQC